MQFDLSGKIADHRLRVSNKTDSPLRKSLVPLLSALVLLAAVAPVSPKNPRRRSAFARNLRSIWPAAAPIGSSIARAYPAGKIPAGAREAAIKELRKMREKSAAAATRMFLRSPGNPSAPLPPARLPSATPPAG